MKIDMSRLFDLMNEADDEKYEYYRSCHNYEKRHGYMPYINMNAGLSEEEQHIVFADKWKDCSETVVSSLIEVLALDENQILRLYSAQAAVKRWYIDTKWERLPSDDLIERLTNFVYGK